MALASYKVMYVEGEVKVYGCGHWSVDRIICCLLPFTLSLKILSYQQSKGFVKNKAKVENSHIKNLKDLTHIKFMFFVGHHCTPTIVSYTHRRSCSIVPQIFYSLRFNISILLFLWLKKKKIWEDKLSYEFKENNQPHCIFMQPLIELKL